LKRPVTAGRFLFPPGYAAWQAPWKILKLGRAPDKKPRFRRDFLQKMGRKCKLFHVEHIVTPYRYVRKCHDEIPKMELTSPRFAGLFERGMSKSSA
jgi:hypothetical protein